MKILITAGKSAKALKLIKLFPEDSIVLADYGEMPSFPSKAYRFISLGIQNDEIIAHNLLSCCLDESADAILPLNEIELKEVQKSKILFEEFNISIITTPDLPNINF